MTRLHRAVSQILACLAFGCALTGFCLAPAQAQVTEIGEFTGDTSESFESFDNYLVGGFHFLDSPTTVLGGSSLTGTEMVVYEVGTADIILNSSGTAQAAEGVKGLNLNNFASSLTLTFPTPRLRFGGYFGAYTSGEPTSILFEFYDGNDTLIAFLEVSYDRSDFVDGLLEWHGWEAVNGIKKVVITGDYVVMDNLQTDPMPAIVSGTVTREDLDPSASARETTFEFREAATGTPLLTRTALLDVSGTFAFSDIPPANYAVSAHRKPTDIDA